MTLSELVFTVRGRENIEDYDAALLESAEQAASAVLAGGLMMDTVANDHIDDAIHALAVQHTEGLDILDASLRRVGDAIQNGCVPVAQDVHGVAVHDISGLACNRWTPEVTAAYYLGLAVGHRLARAVDGPVTGQPRDGLQENRARFIAPNSRRSTP